MPWRDTLFLRASQRARNPVPSIRIFERQISSAPLIYQQIRSVDSVVDEGQTSKRTLPIARHSDLLITAGTEDDVTGIELKIAGLVRSIRKQGKISFAHISDGSTLQPVQAVLPADVAKNITNGSYVELTGKWTESPKKGQAHELQVTTVDRVGETNPDDFPIQKKSLGANFLRTVPHLRMRTPLHSLLTRARSRLSRHINDYYSYVRLNTAYEVHPPLITSSDCEGAGEVFTVTPKTSQPPPSGPAEQDQELSKFYFRSPKYLTVSSQLHLEAYSAELGDVWTLSPTFRAEESDTPRHLSEFYMLEAEFRSVNSLKALLRETEDLVRYLTTSFIADPTSKQFLAYYNDPKYQSSDEIDRPNINLEDRWRRVGGTWTTITYAEAISALQSQSTSQFHFTPSWTSGLQLEHERWLVDNVGNGSPVFVTHYPKHIKPFYMLPSSQASDNPGTPGSGSSEQEETVACFDLLFPCGTAELVGGSLREHRLPNLIHSMREKGLIKQVEPSKSSAEHLYPGLEHGESLGSMQWYADLRRYGSGPHGGFGMGFDRLLGFLTGTKNVRDTVGFPRWFGRADC